MALFEERQDWEPARAASWVLLGRPPLPALQFTPVQSPETRLLARLKFSKGQAVPPSRALLPGPECPPRVSPLGGAPGGLLLGVCSPSPPLKAPPVAPNFCPNRMWGEGLRSRGGLAFSLQSRQPLRPQLLCSDVGSATLPSLWSLALVSLLRSVCQADPERSGGRPASQASPHSSLPGELPELGEASELSGGRRHSSPSALILSQPHCLEVLGRGQACVAGSVLSLSPSPGRPTILQSGPPFFSGNSLRHWTEGTGLRWAARKAAAPWRSVLPRALAFFLHKDLLRRAAVTQAAPAPGPGSPVWPFLLSPGPSEAPTHFSVTSSGWKAPALSSLGAALGPPTGP